MHPLPPLDLSWRDVVDILVISYFVHRLILLFWGTTALQVALTLAFLRLVLAVAQQAGLVLTTWFLEWLNSVALLVIVVIFRNEIREALLLSNPVRLLVGRPEASKAVDFAAVAEAAFRLAKTYTGALLVIQNRDRVTEHARDGVPLGGRFTPPLVEALFSKGSPVHDGAAIVRGGRIERVGTFLPLSHGQGLPEEYGTRHRAAVGLSEVCDAVIVVVSEERGEVSVVHRRAVEVVEGPQALEGALRRRLGRESPAERPRAVARELARLAASYVLTALVVGLLVLWGLHADRQQSLKTVRVAVDFRNLPESLELRSASEHAVGVQVGGKRPLIDTLSADQVGVFVDLRAAGPGMHDVEITADHVTLPPGVDLIKVDPPSLRVVLEPRLSRPIRVEPALSGDVPEGDHIRAIARPAAVRVVGSESDLAALQAVATEPIPIGDLSPARPRKTVEAALILPPAPLKLTEDQPRSVQVELRLIPAAKPPDNQK